MTGDTQLTITIPGRVSPASLGKLTEWLEHAVAEVLGTPCEITVDIPGDRYHEYVERRLASGERRSIREAADQQRGAPTGDLTREDER